MLWRYQQLFIARVTFWISGQCIFLLRWLQTHWVMLKLGVFRAWLLLHLCCCNSQSLVLWLLVTWIICKVFSPIFLLIDHTITIVLYGCFWTVYWCISLYSGYFYCCLLCINTMYVQVDQFKSRIWIRHSNLVFQVAIYYSFFIGAFLSVWCCVWFQEGKHLSRVKLAGNFNTTCGIWRNNCCGKSKNQLYVTVHESSSAKICYYCKGLWSRWL